MKVRDLISGSTLGISLSTPASESSMKATIKSAVTTELIDPGAYLEPESLILTTGLSMRVQDQRIWNAYVERLCKAQVVGIVFGHGSAHQEIPPGLVEAGRQLDMPVLQIPTDVSFLQLQHSINQTIAGERYWLSRKSWEIANTCTRAVSRGAGLIETLTIIKDKTGAEIWISDNFNVPFTGTSAEENAPKITFPLAFSPDKHWNLVASGEETADLEILLSPSIAIVNMVLNKHFEEPLTEGTPALLTAVSCAVQDSIPQIESELASQGLHLRSGLIPIRISATNHSRRNILARMVSHAVSGSQKEIFLQVNEQVFLVAPRPRKNLNVHSSNSAEHWEELLGGLLEPATQDEIIVGRQAEDTEHLLFSLQLLRNTAHKPGLHIAPPLDLPNLIRLLPEHFRTPLRRTVLDKLQAMPDGKKLTEILNAVCTTSTLTHAAAVSGFHRNTVNSAVDKIERILQLDLKDPQNKALCLFALKAET